jgi:hypothetical protein
MLDNIDVVEVYYARIVHLNNINIIEHSTPQQHLCYPV